MPIIASGSVGTWSHHVFFFHAVDQIFKHHVQLAAMKGLSSPPGIYKSSFLCVENHCIFVCTPSVQNVVGMQALIWVFGEKRLKSHGTQLGTSKYRIPFYVKKQSNTLRMRSSRVARASDCQCQSRNSPGFDPGILRHSGI